MLIDQLPLSVQFVLLPLDHLVLLCYLCLLFLDCVEQDNGDAVVFHALYHAFSVVGRQQRLFLRYLFGNETQISHSILLPVKGDRPKTFDQIEPAHEIVDILLVPDTGNTL